MREISWQGVRSAWGPAEAGLDSAEIELAVKLFTELRAPLLRYLASLGVPFDEGEDVLQETFLALFRHLRDGKPRDNLTGWTFRVARNLTLKRMRSARSSTAAGPLPVGLDVPDGSANPEEQAMEARQARDVAAVLRALPELDRDVLRLRREGLRYREIAEALEISLGSVAASIARSLSRLAAVARR